MLFRSQPPHGGGLQPGRAPSVIFGAAARLTGGRYFRATDKEKLQAIYDEINQLEKSRVEVTERITYHELFLGWVLAALALLTAELLLSNLVLKRIP